MSLESYDKLADLESELWVVVKKRKSNYFDTARYQALAMLSKLGDKKARKQLEAISKDAFTDSAKRRKVPYFNEYFYVDVLARQQDPYFVELMLDMAEQKDVVPTSCQLIHDYIVSYGQSDSFTDAQQKRHSKLCGGTAALESYRGEHQRDSGLEIHGDPRSPPEIPGIPGVHRSPTESPGDYWSWRRWQSPTESHRVPQSTAACRKVPHNAS